MRRLAIWLNSLLFLTGLTLELTGVGLITRLREDLMYDFIARTGMEWVFVMLYFFFFFIQPVINLIAIISKDRGILIEQAG